MHKVKQKLRVVDPAKAIRPKYPFGRLVKKMEPQAPQL